MVLLVRVQHQPVFRLRQLFGKGGEFHVARRLMRHGLTQGVPPQSGFGEVAGQGKGVRPSTRTTRNC